MRSGNLLFTWLAACALLCSTRVALADELSVIRAQISATRAAVIELVSAPERRTTDRTGAVVELATQVADRLATLKVPVDQQALLASIRADWAAYRVTLESEFLPALAAGSEDAARRAALRLQREQATLLLKRLALLHG